MPRVICLGAVMRGETTHDQHINRQVSLTLGRHRADTMTCPCSLACLTCNNMEQAIQRAGGNVGNKGAECAEAALEMVRSGYAVGEGVKTGHVAT